MNEKEEAYVCWNQDDYDLGRVNGLWCRILLRGSLEAANVFMEQYAPDLVKYLGPILRFLAIGG